MNPVTRQLISDHSFLIGNVTPVSWYQYIRTAPTPTKNNGSPDMVAVAILSDIMYWYRPTEIRDESTGQVIDYRTKFAANKLQKRYQAYADMLGVSKAKVKLSFDLLVKLGLITREFRTISTQSLGPISNVMFIEPVMSGVIKISVPPTLPTPSPQKVGGPPQQKRGDKYKEYSNKKTYVRTPSPEKQTPAPKPQPEKEPQPPPSPEIKPAPTDTELAIAALILLIPESLRKPSVIAKLSQAIQNGLTLDLIKSCVEYSNDHSHKRTWQEYKGHLGKCLDGAWGDGYSAGDNAEYKDKIAINARLELPLRQLQDMAKSGDKYAVLALQTIQRE